MNADLLIGGKECTALTEGTFERRNPLTGEVVTCAAAATSVDAEAAATAASHAFPVWSATSPSERRKLLNTAADNIDALRADFVLAMGLEIGATAAWANFNVSLAAQMLREAAAMTTQILGQVIPSDKPGCVAMAVRRPAGVCVGIAPWNAPVILGVRAIAMPLACGNTVVLKASEICPRTHRLIGKAISEAGVPAGTINVICNSPADAAEVVESLIFHPAVRRINFTGSTRVGRIVAAKAAQVLKPVLLELGGKAPLLVLDDADLDEAVKAAAFGAFMNQGQICMSTERIIVDEKVADAFVEKLAEKSKTLVANDPSTPTALGTMVSMEAADHVMALIEDAGLKGARLLCGPDRRGTLLNATVLDNVTPAMRIYAEETFGPVVSVMRFKTIDEAVQLANDTEYGLSAAVFGKDMARALSVANRIESGICHINGPTVHDEAQMPFGGTKGSGYGRFGGTAGIAEFTELRWITMETQPGHFPI